MVDRSKSPVLFVQKVNTQTYLLPRTWCLPERLCYLLASRIPLARWQLTELSEFEPWQARLQECVSSRTLCTSVEVGMTKVCSQSRR